MVKYHNLLLPAEKAHDSNMNDLHSLKVELEGTRELEAGVLRLPASPVLTAQPVTGEANSKKAKKNKAQAAQARADALSAAEAEGPEEVARVTLENANAVLAEAQVGALAAGVTLAACQAEAVAVDAHTVALDVALADIARIRPVPELQNLVEKYTKCCRLSAFQTCRWRTARSRPT